MATHWAMGFPADYNVSCGYYRGLAGFFVPDSRKLKKGKSEVKKYAILKKHTPKYTVSENRIQQPHHQK
jgi:hypothetical protein